ncbi:MULTISPECIES: nucleoside-diphosphate sugar epimerase/dehydratase [unclassified Gemella]|uniref:polysaccharide biosynthesis protein n=1 Tax=unclassified Gemella TaxID=2624949 RepID=UPI0015CF8C86|nr:MULTISPECIES: nucleoside-diphosphate sugar epimerase/dehydratase [unclassified Gemella]MBF0710516.1 polysaccharide biosynthesis protein [Gemella sp. GL1.1]NYS27860.1 polysaccharide biosynthesis protein [Gemella sp. GL1]
MDKLFSWTIYSKYRLQLILIIDLLFVIIGNAAAVFLDRTMYIDQILYKFSTQLSLFLLISSLIYSLLFSIFSVYKSLWSYIGIREIVNICISVLISNFFVSILYNFIFTDNFSHIRFTIFAPLLIISGMTFARLVYRALLEAHRRKNKTSYYKNTLIIGAGDAAYLLIKELHKNNRFKANIVGLIDDNRVNSTVNGINVLGRTSEIKELIEKYDVNLVFLAIPSISASDKNRILDILKEVSHVEIKIMKEGLDLLEAKSLSKHIKDVSIEDLLGRGEIKLEKNEIQSYISDKVVLITGAGGSIGSQIAKEVFEFKPKYLVLTDINENSLYMLERDFDFKKLSNSKYENIEYISEIVSIREKENLRQVFDKYRPDVVFHAAAHKHVPLMERRPQEAVKNNVVGTKNVMEVAVDFKVERFIMISTDKAVNPTNVMGASKRLTEIILQAKANKYDTKFAAVRFGNVLGSNGSVIPIFKEQIKKGGPLTITHRNIIRYFMTIPEAAQLVLQAGFYASEGEIFLLDMGEPVKIIDLAKSLIKLSGLEVYKDIEIKEIGLRPGEKMFEELSLDYENSEKTDNEMIFKNKVLNIDEEQLNRKLERLELLVQNGNNTEIREYLFKIINEYNGKEVEYEAK